MALIKIFHDVFDICNRIKEIDDGYYAVYNTSKNSYEIHNFKQESSTSCISCPNGLDARVINKLRKTKIENLDKLLKEIEKNNEMLELNAKNKVKDEAMCKSREMFDYAKSKTEDVDFKNSYITKWS